jgi:putative nucleotidyltransferase with HDIG domain
LPRSFSAWRPSNCIAKEELLHFLQLLLPLLKKRSGADLILAKNQERLPHILAGALPFETGPQLSYEELSGALQKARQSLLSFSGQIQDLFSDLEGPLSPAKIGLAKETIETIHKMTASGDLPLKILIYRRSSDPDPYHHAVNVAAISMALARHIGLREEVIRDLGLGALLHDIGLHIVHEPSLSKTAVITLGERKCQLEHPIRGAEILLATTGIPDVVPLMAYEHHLAFDGGGYPEQQYPRDLTLAGMLLHVTDSYDNLRRNRPEQDALSLTNALNRMDHGFGTDFHPLLLKQFRAMVKAQAQEGA